MGRYARGGPGPRHIDWGPGGCARRSPLFGHSLNVGRAAAAAAAAAEVPTTVAVALSERPGTPGRDHSDRYDRVTVRACRISRGRLRTKNIRNINEEKLPTGMGRWGPVGAKVSVWEGEREGLLRNFVNLARND